MTPYEEDLMLEHGRERDYEGKSLDRKVSSSTVSINVIGMLYDKVDAIEKDMSYIRSKKDGSNWG